MTVARTICLGFMAVIALGTLLLLLPIAQANGEWGNWITALFTSTSAVCVTGLVVVDTGSHFSFLGQLFILMLIQIGGLGYMTVTTFLLLLLGRRFGLRDKVAIQQSLDKTGLSGADQVIRSIIAVTLIIELTGAFAMMPVFTPQYGLRRSLWLSVFHSISAFNNAGFGLFPDNMISYATSVPINLIIPLLIILGGIGYGVIMEAYLWVRNRIQGSRIRDNFSLNFKVAVSTTLFLLAFGVVIIFAIESHDPETFGAFNFQEKLLVSWFQAVVPRTAGFNSIDYGKMTDAGLFVTIMLMFVGASPGGTGGGIKTTTFRILFDCTKAILLGKEEVLCYQRQIPTGLILKSVGVVFGSVMTVLTATMLIALVNPEIEFIRILFESVSAFATVGLSTNLTPLLSPFAQLVLVATMYVGRVGVLLLMSAVLGDPDHSVVHYPEGNLLIG